MPVIAAMGSYSDLTTRRKAAIFGAVPDDEIADDEVQVVAEVDPWP